eukprot:PITA_31801
MHIDMGDDARYNATDIGIITIQRESRSSLILKDEMFVLGLKKNLVSVAVLEDCGYDVIFSKGKDFLRHITTGQVKHIVVRVKSIYKLDVEYCAALSTKAEKVQSRYVSELWRRRLGHLHHGNLKIMQHISTSLHKGALEQRNTTSIAKHMYYVIFVDDFSRKQWIYFMQNKDQKFSKFVEFKEIVEKETGKKVKALKSDNGGEYMSNEFKIFCAKEGIQWELKTPHNPQQNGVDERKNISIVGVPRAMLHDQSLPLQFWVEACNTSVYLRNKTPHGILGMSTPEEYFLRKKPDVSHFRIFGSLVYYHVSKEARKKLDLAAKFGIFLGYTDTPHNYHVYLPSLRMKMLRKDVKFDEEKVMRCSIEREFQLQLDQDLLAPKEEPREIVE